MGMYANQKKNYDNLQKTKTKIEKINVMKPSAIEEYPPTPIPVKIPAVILIISNIILVFT